MTEKTEQFTLMSEVDVMALGARINQSQFAKLLGVSKSRVCQLVKDGTIQLGTDGLLNPAVAARQYHGNVDPARARSRVMKLLANDTSELKNEIERLTKALADSKTELTDLETAFDYELEEQGVWIHRTSLLKKALLIFISEVAGRLPELALTPDPADALQTIWEDILQFDTVAPEFNDD